MALGPHAASAPSFAGTASTMPAGQLDLMTVAQRLQFE